MTPWITKPVPFNIGLTPAAAGGGSGFDLSNLKAYYKFCNDPTVSNLENQASSIGSSDSNGADLSNSNVTTATGLIDEGYDYDLSNGQSADTGGAGTDFEFMYNTSSAEFSFVGWLKPNTTSRTNNRTIWDNADIGNANGCGLGEYHPLSKHRLFFYLSKPLNADDEFFYSPDNSYPDTTDWRMVYVSFEASSQEVKFSINDGAVSTLSSSITGISGASYSPMSFGSGRSPAIYETDSICDEWSFWNRILTSEEITTLYNSGSGFAL